MVSGGVTAAPAWVLSVGDELLCGRTVDTNAGEIQRELAARGVAVGRVSVVPDDRDAIAAALSETPAGALVLVTGGLGPTGDDLTREAVANWAGAPLEPDPDIAAAFRERCRRRGVKCSEGLLRQAMAPRGMRALANPVGTAPALVGELGGRRLALMPGVPAEMRALLPGVLDALGARPGDSAAPPSLRLRTAQIFESVLAGICAPIRAAHPGTRWSWWLSPWGVDVQVGAASAGPQDAAEFAAAAGELRSALGTAVYAENGVGLPEVVQDLLVADGGTLAVAESCTGGMLGAAVTGVPGSSAVFLGGILSYADRIKESLLGVEPGVLAEHGAVSGECALQMASGCREALAGDYALAVTGIAGPDGGTPAKPVGTTWIALASPSGVWARAYRFPAGRERNRILTVAAALDSLRRHLQDPGRGSPWPEDAE